MTVTPERRTAVFYFVLFLTGGVANLYLGLWLDARGLSEQQIGVINAAPVLVMLLMTLVVGRIADRARDWRQVIVAGALASGLFSFGLIWAPGFWAILLVWTLHAVTHMSIIPVLDAATMRMTARNGTQFGVQRAWGTVGYLLMLIATGYAALLWGPQVFLPLLIGAAVLRGVLALGLPNFRAPDDGQARKGATRLRQVMKPWFLLPLLGFAAVNATHHLQNAFQGLIWQRQGISTDVIGLLIALGALSETVMFFVFGRFAHRFRARTLLMVSAVVSVARWSAMAFAPSIPWLIVLQSLHGISYAMGFLACVQFIANWTSEDIAAEAQGFFVTLHQIMSVAALTGFGWLLAQVGDLAFLAAAVMAAAGAGAIWVSRRVQGPDAT